MVADLEIFDEPHYQSLEFIAARSLASANPVSAFKYADRRCRIFPVPESHCYVLRAEASYRMGQLTTAIADISKALKVSPSDISANRRMLDWARGPLQLNAALALVEQEYDLENLRKVIKLLCKRGHRSFAHATVFDDSIVGWALWNGPTPLTISITDGIQNTSTDFAADIFHPLSAYGDAISFTMSRPQSSNAQSILFSANGSVFHAMRAAGNVGVPHPGGYRPRTTSARNVPVTVIVPVHGDFEATKLCLETLRRELNSTKHQAIVINDATPDRRIGRYLAEFDSERIQVLVNNHNRGFVGSVNRALEQIARGDVVLLNADTVVPPGFIDRLATAAYSSADIGTVTPLSNNGEFTSFPTPNASNPLPSCKEIIRINEIAAIFNAGEIVEIPSGIGFCLYVTRTCLDSVGLLSEEYGYGYLEDADLCLRARARGFRSVCATSVYVGHAGSKSFKEKKRSIVVRNLRLLEQRFPTHRSECAAFMAADPLRSARRAIEEAVATKANRPRLLVTGAGAIAVVAQQRASEIISKKQPALILEVHYRPDRISVKIRNPTGGIPQSLEFALSSVRKCPSLFDYLQSAAPSRIEFLDPANTPATLTDLLLRLKIPYDIFIADAGLLGPAPAQPSTRAIASLCSQRPAPAALPARVVVPAMIRKWTRRWRKITAEAEGVLVPSAEAETFVKSISPARALRRVAIARPKRSQKKKINLYQTGLDCRLGLVPVRACAQEQRLLKELTCGFAKARPDVSVTIIGGTLDDIDLMRSPNTFVTGAVLPEEFERLVASLGIRRLFISTTRPIFGHPIQSAVRAMSLPIAYFDWSKGQIDADKYDLPVNPNSALTELICELSRWIPAS